MKRVILLVLFTIGFLAFASNPQGNKPKTTHKVAHKPVAGASHKVASKGTHKVVSKGKKTRASLANVKVDRNLFEYQGRYCSGAGDINFLRLLDESFAFFHPNAVVPNLTMIYNPAWDTFTEGAGWGAWWIQNSYGFSYAATPLLQEPWASVLQRSWDLFWDNQGDGIRKGGWGDDQPNKLSELVAPDGSLGDAAAPGKIIFKQGDGKMEIHDWFYEATAAGLVMQSEILLTNRDKGACQKYLPKMERACEFIERTRDPKNNLFLVGPACNLLAPSYGGVKKPDGTFGKGYLTGLSVTYLAALDRMIEIYTFLGDQQRLALFQHRQQITRASLSQLLTSEGYLIKSLEPNGTRHGVLGQPQYSYLEGVANADAVALRVVDRATSESIYHQIETFPAIRPFDFLLTNAPGLDDTYGAWGKTTGKGLEGFWNFGDWVNGGVWGTVEGRAILMYYRLGKFEDIRRSATRAMRWAKDFRMDAPWSQKGENSSNPWSDTGKFKVGGVAVMVDNFAIPAATLRGLFDYDYKADRLILRPRIPGSITQYTQKEPVRFGTKQLYLTCINGGPFVKSVKVNGNALAETSREEITLYYDQLPKEARVEIETEGGWPLEPSVVLYPIKPALAPLKNQPEATVAAMLPESLKKPMAVLASFNKKLATLEASEADKSLVTNALLACQECQNRLSLNPGPGYYRTITAERKSGIEQFYEKTALSMYEGVANRMSRYAQKGDASQKRLAELFFSETK